MENRARLVGYIVILLSLGIFLWGISVLKSGILFPHHRIQVAFPSIGTLMTDDPVKMQGVEVGRVEKISAGNGVAIATLEMYKRGSLPKDCHFINYNYSLFGARMVILVPGQSKEVLNEKEIQSGEFISGVTETIHRVDGLLKTVIEFRNLAAALENGNDSTPSLQALMTEKVYPTLAAYGKFSEEMEALQNTIAEKVTALSASGNQLNAFSRKLTSGSDTILLKANESLEQLAILTAQGDKLLTTLDKILAHAQDTSQAGINILVQRDLYDRTLVLNRSLQSLLKAMKNNGVQDLIYFWRNVHIHFGKPKN